MSPSLAVVPLSTDTTPPSASLSAGGVSRDFPLSGFRCLAPAPDVLVIVPNRDRSREQASQMLCRGLAFGLFSLVLLTLTVTLAGDPLQPAGGRAASVLSDAVVQATVVIIFGLLSFASGYAGAVSLGLFFMDAVLYRSSAITLDRATDRLLYGGRLVCRLSDVRCVLLRRVYLTGRALQRTADGRARYGVALELTNGRTLPRFSLVLPHLRYTLGPQDWRSEAAVAQIAAFMGADVRLEVHHWDAPGPSPGGF